MPTPIGHALAGVTIAWCAASIQSAQLDSRDRAKLAVGCAALAIAPDLDLVYPPIHRTMTHSFVAVGVVWAVAALAARRVRPGTIWQLATVCALAYASHLGLDWLGGDTKLPAGIQLLWPFRREWYISSMGVFHALDLGGFFRIPAMITNTLAVLREVAILGPICLGAWLLQRRIPEKKWQNGR